MATLQQERIQFMTKIAQEINSATGDVLVLKGGTSLLLAHKLDRFSEDMDFDGKRPVELNKMIERAAQKCGVPIESITLKKDTETTKRYMVHYGAEREGGAYPLKIECSFRQAATIDEKDIVEVDGMRVYRIEKLVEQKVNALFNRETARDIYDVHFLLAKVPDAFSPSVLEQLAEGIKERGIDALLKTFEDDAATDHILQNTDAVDIVIGLEQAVNRLKEQKQLLEKIIAAPTVNELPKTPNSKELFAAYAKEALASSPGSWKPELDKSIIFNMKKNGISDQRITAALGHSPALLGLSSVEKGIKTRTLVREVIKEHPELAKSRGMSR